MIFPKLTMGAPSCLLPESPSGRMQRPLGSRNLKSPDQEGQADGGHGRNGLAAMGFSPFWVVKWLLMVVKWLLNGC